MSASPSGLDSDDSSSAHEERGSSVLSDWYDNDSYGTMSETTAADSDDPQDFDGFQCRLPPPPLPGAAHAASPPPSY